MLEKAEYMRVAKIVGISNYHSLETGINNWLRANKHTDVLDIKFHGDTALIIYRR